MKKIIIISAINFYVGGPLTILKECVNALESKYADTYRIIIFVHDRKLITNSNVEVVEFKHSRKSWLLRLYYEYIYFWFLSLKIKPYLWFSLHDITPNIISQYRVVYCHNTSPFYVMNKEEKRLDRTFALYNKYYEFVYRINIKKNNFVIVQQDWLRKEFAKRFGLKNIIVAHPVKDRISTIKIINEPKKNKDKLLFFYPALPRNFKNFELLGEAVKLLLAEGIANFELKITIDGTENKYATHILNNYGGLVPLKFIGLQDKSNIVNLYKESDYLIFPSRLESWGLPLTEYKEYNKPMFVANLPYAKETVSSYSKVNFFEPNNAAQLAELMRGAITNSAAEYDKTFATIYKQPFADNWDGLFAILFNQFKD